jgi:hypothetical protein
MTFDLPPLVDAARDPDQFIPELEAKQQEAKDRLRGISAALREVRKIKASAEHLEYIQQHGVPRPRDPETGGSVDDGDGEASEEARQSRREQVLALLAQAPERRWKVRDLAGALEIQNLKSLRTSMDEFARSGVVEKDQANSSYFLGRRGYQATF